MIGFEPLVDDPATWERFLPVPEEPGAHVVLLGGETVLMSTSAPRSRELFEARGLRVVAVDISEFEKLEGCVTCLSVRLRGIVRRASRWPRCWRARSLVKNQASKKPARSSPRDVLGERLEVLGGAVAVGRSGQPGPQERPEVVVADPLAQRLERHRPAVVDLGVEDVRRLPGRSRSGGPRSRRWALSRS